MVEAALPSEALIWISLAILVYFIQGYLVLRLHQLGLYLTRKIRGLVDDEYYYNSKKRDEKKVESINVALDCVVTQALGWLAFILLFRSIIFNPFVLMNGSLSRLVFLCLCFHTGKLAFKAYETILVQLYLAKGFYYIVHLCTFIIFIMTKTNSLLGLLAIMCEISDVHQTLRTLLKISRVPRFRTCFLFNSVLGVIVTIAFRGVIPVIGLCISISHANPMQLNKTDIIVFFFYLTVLLSINIWFIIYSLLKLQEVILIRRLFHLTTRNLHTKIDTEKRTTPEDIRMPDFPYWNVCHVIHTIKNFIPKKSTLKSINVSSYYDQNLKNEFISRDSKNVPIQL